MLSRVPARSQSTIRLTSKYVLVGHVIKTASIAQVQLKFYTQEYMHVHYICILSVQLSDPFFKNEILYGRQLAMLVIKNI